MKYLNKILPLIILISCSKNNNRETEFIDFFINKYWTAEVYSNECTGHNFNHDWKFIISGTHHPIDFSSNLTPINLDDSTIVIDKNVHDRIRMTDNKYPNYPLDENEYFVRLTPLYQQEGDYYQGIWVKGGFYTSGYY